MALPSRLRADLFLGILFLAVSDQRAHWTGGHPAGRGLSFCRGRAFSELAPLCLRAHVPVVVSERSHADLFLLAGAGGIGDVDSQSMAAGQPGGLFSELSFLRIGGAGLLRVPVRWDAAGSRIHLHLLRAPGLASRAGRGPCAFATQPVSPALGMVP